MATPAYRRCVITAHRIAESGIGSAAHNNSTNEEASAEVVSREHATTPEGTFRDARWQLDLDEVLRSGHMDDDSGTPHFPDCVGFPRTRVCHACGEHSNAASHNPEPSARHAGSSVSPNTTHSSRSAV